MIMAGSLPVLAQTRDTVDHLAPKSNGDGMDTHLFRPALDSKGFFYSNGSDVLPANDVSFGLTLDYGRNLLRNNPDREEFRPKALVQDSFQGVFQFNYGIANRAALGVTLPVVLMYAATGARDVGPTGGTYDVERVNVQEVSTVALHGKLRITSPEKGAGLAVALQGGIPVGTTARDLGAEPGYWYWPRAILETRFAQQKLRIGLDGGFRGHTGENAVFDLDSAGLPQLAEGRLEYGNLATFGLGISYRVLQALDLVAETYGTYLLSDSNADQKLSEEVVGGLKVFIDGKSYLMVAGGSRAFSTGFEAADGRVIIGFVFEPSIGDRDGDGIPDDRDQCPDVPEDKDGFQDEDGCPDLDNDNDGIPDREDRCPDIPEDLDGDRDDDGCPEHSIKDRDGDGILDVNDQCPDDPEDKDGFEDEDGCPDLDNDKDGIPDVDDACPNVPEDKDGFQDEDGCPDLDNDQDRIPDLEDKCPDDPETYNGLDDQDGCPDQGRVIVEGTDIIILDKVQFATNSAKILPASEPIIEAVAATLAGHPEFLVVEVAGHADERGADHHNLNLTRARAAAVEAALRARGVAASRLVSQGYGEYCPVDSKRNPEAYEKNRRVEFKIVKNQQEGLTKVERGCPAAVAAGVKPPEVK